MSSKKLRQSPEFGDVSVFAAAALLFILACARTTVICLHFHEFRDNTNRIGLFYVKTAEADVPGDGIDPFSVSPGQIRKMQMGSNGVLYAAVAFSCSIACSIAVYVLIAVVYSRQLGKKSRFFCKTLFVVSGICLIGCGCMLLLAYALANAASEVMLDGIRYAFELGDGIMTTTVLENLPCKFDGHILSNDFYGNCMLQIRRSMSFHQYYSLAAVCLVIELILLLMIWRKTLNKLRSFAAETGKNGGCIHEVEQVALHENRLLRNKENDC